MKRNLQVASLHRCVNGTLEPLAECAVEVLLRETSDKRYLLLYLMKASYVADISESEELPMSKRGKRTATPCYMWEVGKGNLFPYTKAPGQCWKNVREILSNHMQGKRSTSHSAPLPDHMLLMLLLFIIIDFSFTGIDESVDVYALSRIEPVYNLFFGRARVLNEYLRAFLSVGDKKTSMF